MLTYLTNYCFQGVQVLNSIIYRIIIIVSPSASTALTSLFKKPLIFLEGFVPEMVSFELTITKFYLYLH